MRKMIKNINKIQRLIVIGLFLILGKISLAAYTPFEKIPGQGNITNLQQYLEGLYKFGIAVVAILAVVMIAVGAFMYIVTSAGSAGKLANAKEIITSAIVGLVMALLAWLILFVINPDLVGTSLRMEKVNFSNLISDGNPDDICSNLSVGAENGWCSGESFCVDGQCIYKKNICLIGKSCSANVVQPDSPCGVSGPNGLIGTCSGFQQDCRPGQVRVTDGKQCVNSVCCLSGL